MKHNLTSLQSQILTSRDELDDFISTSRDEVDDFICRDVVRSEVGSSIAGLGDDGAQLTKKPTAVFLEHPDDFFVGNPHIDEVFLATSQATMSMHSFEESRFVSNVQLAELPHRNICHEETFRGGSTHETLNNQLKDNREEKLLKQFFMFRLGDFPLGGVRLGVPLGGVRLGGVHLGGVQTRLC